MSEVIMVGGCSIAQGGGCRSCGGRGCGACCKKVAYMGKDGKPFIPRYGSTVLMPDPEGCVAGVITPEQDLCAPFSSGYSACQQKRIIKQLEDGVLVLTPDDGVVVSVAAGQGFPDEAIQWQFETPWWACYSFSNFILDLNEQDAGRYTVAVNSTEVADDGRGTWVDAVNPGPITRLQVVEETQFRNTQTMMQIGQTAKSSQGRKACSRSPSWATRRPSPSSRSSCTRLRPCCRRE